MTIINFTGKLTHGGDFIIPADILSNLDLDTENALTLTHFQMQDDDMDDETDNQVIHIEINVEDDDEFDAVFSDDIDIVLEELDGLHQKVDALTHILIETLAELCDFEKGDESDEETEANIQTR